MSAAIAGETLYVGKPPSSALPSRLRVLHTLLLAILLAKKVGDTHFTQNHLIDPLAPAVTASSMSSPTRFSRRRRSHSASSPVSCRQTDDVKFRIAIKRARPSSIRSPSYKDIASGPSPEKWDVDQWRRGKRARRDLTSEYGTIEKPLALTSDSVFLEERASSGAHSTSSGLPCTSAAFQLFPKRKKARRIPSLFSQQTSPTAPSADEHLTPDDLNRLRSDAFGELHRSVAESGEGLVQRMRNWEHSRVRCAHPERSAADGLYRESRRRRSAYYNPERADIVAEAMEDDDDIVIVSGEASPGSPSFQIRGSSQKKRALSMSIMDVDLPELGVHTAPFDESERSSSPIDVSSGLSAYSSDDEELCHPTSEVISSLPGVLSPPALSHTYTTSTNSSLISLPLSLPLLQASDSHQSWSPSSFPCAHIPGPPPQSVSPCVPSTASRSEKAIAALTLAMANGAGGLNDYEALRLAEGASALDQCDVGELWN
ncbi:hypothetical protein A0H81_00645 [Grifola frondosa]|uniref:Uncharacterized protein n=1 Tax=Grifola frondosa TaxID=5627 RepID=A0A1C7MPA8_GRIFR|nr:hypothetical protein A0H81_00645 [Grifola frondosa]